ncbi:MAG: protein O-mannosyl-transferase [Verrucomicrobiota bacterium]
MIRAKAPAFAIVVVLAAITAVYANHFHNGFHFDDAHTIENNAAIRELKNVPRFFTDATTFSSLPSNQSYRPIVSTLLTLCYSLGGGLKPFWFHLPIFALYLTLVLLAALVVRHLLDHAADSPTNAWVALGAAALFGLHPANADTVNYLIASSEVITALGVVGSFAVYIAFPRLRRSCLYVLPAATAILAKPPAAIFAILFVVYRLLFPDEKPRRVARDWLLDLLPPFLICGGLLWFVQTMTPPTWIAGASGAHGYLLTQPYVAWLYFKTFFWPAALSADYDLSAFTTTDDGRFWIGFGFTVVFVAAAGFMAAFRKTRLIGFGLLWFLITLLPTSLFPLAEVMNDHRTFLSYLGLVIVLAGFAQLVLLRKIASSVFVKGIAGGALVMVLSISGYATYQRNKVWKDEESLWRDVTIKSPSNGRGLMNYGLTLMAKGDYSGALDYFHRAQAFTPYYSLLSVNLGIVEGALGKAAVAEEHFKEALRLAPAEPDSYTYYARWLIAQSRPGEALPLLSTAVHLAPTDIFARSLLTHAQQSAPQTPEAYLALSLTRYQEKRYEEAIAACELALALKPDYAEAWNNLCASSNQLGEYEQAITACEEALRFQPDFALARNNLNYARRRANASGK